jgi:hypothetical protein
MNNSEIAIFESTDQGIVVNAKVVDDNIWLSQD